jgi:MFS transporter, ACS family, allantoate permease
MAIQRASLEAEKKSSSSVDEKRAADAEVVSVDDTLNGDEALQLVGRERTEQFSEEYNRRLRRKLVSFPSVRTGLNCSSRQSKDFIIPPLCAAVYFTQFLYVRPYPNVTGIHVLLQ